MANKYNIPKKIEEAINSDNLVLFIGAGCSMPHGLPSWNNLIEEILVELDDKFGDIASINFKNILSTIHNNSKSVFTALNKIEKDEDHGNTYKTKAKEIVARRIDKSSGSFPAESIIHEYLWKLSDKIITTNYDNLIEKYRPQNFDGTIFDNTNTYQHINNQLKGSKFIYKIHGDFQNPESMILFESDYLKIYNDDNSNSDLLSKFIKDKTLLFIGFSLNDPFINNLFKKIKSIYNGFTINEHFLISTKNDDFIDYDITIIKIEDWDQDLILLLQELYKVKSNIVSSSNLSKNELESIIQVFNKKIQQLQNNPNDKSLIKEVRDLEKKIKIQLSSEINFLQVVNPSFRSNDLQNLFDIIYSSEKLDEETIYNIHKVRTNTDLYKWFDRSVIVSAITCSLIHFNKADEKKIILLIDFINDNEDKVWQKSLASLFIVLNHLGNKWLRFANIKAKVKTLNENIKIQQACYQIVQLFSIELHTLSLINDNLFKNEYYSDNAFNYFLPFHQESNEIFDQVYDNYEGNVEKFIDFLKNLPVPDQLKYLLCSQKFNYNKDEQTNDQALKDSIKQILDFNSLFYPYSIYIQEIISFYKHFPKYKHEEKLKSQLRITDTPLKDYLLNEKHKKSSLGYYFMYDNNWSQAIVNFEEAAKLGNDLSDLLNLAICYHNIDDLDNELKIRKQIHNIDQKNEINISGLFDISYNEEKYAQALEYAEQLIHLDKSSAIYQNYKGICMYEFNKFDDAILYYTNAIKLDPSYSTAYYNRGNIYLKLFKSKEAIDDYTQAIKNTDQNAHYYYKRAEVYFELDLHKDAISDLNIAIKSNPKNLDYLLSRVACNLALEQFEKAYEDLVHGLSLNDKSSSVFNMFANYYRMIGNYDLAFNNLDRAEKLEEEEARFIGTRATIYASMDNNDLFFKYLEEAFVKKAEARYLLPDIKNKYKEDPFFMELLQKYKQVLPSYQLF